MEQTNQHHILNSAVAGDGRTREEGESREATGSHAVEGECILCGHEMDSGYLCVTCGQEERRNTAADWEYEEAYED